MEISYHQFNSQKNSMTAYPIHEAARTGDRKLINETVTSIDQLNAVDEAGRTPIHVAAEVNEAAMGAYMAECGADVNAKDHAGDTPLHVGARHGSRLTVSMLLWAEADPMLVNLLGETPLHLAVSAGHRDVVWLLLENGGGEAAVNVRDLQGRTPLEIGQNICASDEILDLLRKAQL